MGEDRPNGGLHKGCGLCCAYFLPVCMKSFLCFEWRLNLFDFASVIKYFDTKSFLSDTFLILSSIFF